MRAELLAATMNRRSALKDIGAIGAAATVQGCASGGIFPNGTNGKLRTI
jgi:hypothetical protein